MQVLYSIMQITLEVNITLIFIQLSTPPYISINYKVSALFSS